jgi:hypothetical protein
MKNWKQITFLAVFLFIGGVFYINAQDMIILKDGNVIEAIVVEISPMEIRYKRFEHLDGPTIVIPAVNVLSIRYENGNYEIINAGVIPQQGNTQTVSTAMDPNKFTFGINANAGGALGYIWKGGTGAGINIELGKGRFNSEISLFFPNGGFGFLITLNAFFPSRVGGFYLGGGLGYSSYHGEGEVVHRNGNRSYDEFTLYSIPLGLNIGYKFVTKSGLYFRTGVYAAFDFGKFANGVYEPYISPGFFKPDFAIGWTMR